MPLASVCRFVTGGSDMWVRLHDFETGQELEVCKGECIKSHNVFMHPLVDI